MAFSRPFTPLVSQDVPWIETSVRVVTARIERDSDPHSYSATLVYAELDLAITNHGQDDGDYHDRDTWDLILADGTRIRSENSVGVLVSRGDTAKTTLRYPVPAGTSLVGSFLELNGRERGKLEPERIPLDTKWQRKYPLEIESLRGDKVTQPDHDPRWWLELAILDARIDVNDPEGRAPTGMKFVHFDVKATTGDHDEVVFNDYFRMVVDGSSYAPVNSATLQVAANTSKTLEVLFTVPSNTTQFEFQMKPGDMSMRFGVDLTKDAHLGSADGDAGAPDAGL